MNFFQKLFGEPQKPQSEKKKSDMIIDHMFMMAENLLNEGRDELAVKQYQHILELCPDTMAQYNLGSLHAQGKGVKQDFREGAYYFRQAEKNGDEASTRMVLKCELDYIRPILVKDNPAELYAQMEQFVARVYPEEDAKTRIAKDLNTIGLYYFNKSDYDKAATLLRTGAELCDDGQAQNYLAVLYNTGAGVENNDLVALYWFDRATDNGFKASKKDRDGILNAYRNTLSKAEFIEYMEILSDSCENGSDDIPKTPSKVQYWHRMAQ